MIDHSTSLKHFRKKKKMKPCRTLSLKNMTKVKASVSRLWLIVHRLFQSDGELRLPRNVMIAKLKKFRDVLNIQLVSVQQRVEEQASAAQGKYDAEASTSSAEVQRPKKASQRTEIEIIPTRPFHERTTFSRVIVSVLFVVCELWQTPSPQSIHFQPFNNSYLQQLETSSDMVMQYEDERLLRCGRELIPIDRLNENAVKKLRLIQKEIVSKRAPIDAETCLQDLILCELVRWFNEEFFTWVNSLPCKKCGNEDVPTKGSCVENGVRVEVWWNCEKKKILSKLIRHFFHRHTHAATKPPNFIDSTTLHCCWRRVVDDVANTRTVSPSCVDVWATMPECAMRHSIMCGRKFIRCIKSDGCTLIRRIMWSTHRSCISTDGNGISIMWLHFREVTVLVFMKISHLVMRTPSEAFPINYRRGFSSHITLKYRTSVPYCRRCARCHLALREQSQRSPAQTDKMQWGEFAADNCSTA